MVLNPGLSTSCPRAQECPNACVMRLTTRDHENAVLALSVSWLSTHRQVSRQHTQRQITHPKGVRILVSPCKLRREDTTQPQLRECSQQQRAEHTIAALISYGDAAATVRASHYCQASGVMYRIIASSLLGS